MGSNDLNALPGKAFSKHSEDFSAAQRRESIAFFLVSIKRRHRRTCAAVWLWRLLLEPQQPLGVSTQDGVLLLVSERQGAEALQALLLAAPGAVGAEQEPLVSEGADEVQESLERFRALPLTNEEKDAILGGNAQRLLGFQKQ